MNGYGLQPDQARRSCEYTEKLFEQLTELAATAIADIQPARLAWSTGKADFVMNRREFTDRGIKLGVNRQGHVDDVVPVLRVTSADGALRGLVFGCACHNTTLGGKNLKICSEYAGCAQEFIEERLPGVQAMFVIGCGGAANPYPRGTVENVRQHGQSLGAEVCRVASGKLQPIRGSLRVEFDYAGFFSPQAETATVAKVSELAEKEGGNCPRELRSGRP